MKTIKITLALLILGIAISCKKSGTLEENVAFGTSTDSSAIISSSAAVEPKNNSEKFVRTADIKFKVKNVAKSTNVIEDATTKFGGYVAYTNLQSNIVDENKTKISPDSSLVTTKYNVENNIVIRIPNTKLDTVIKTIAHQICFLNYRVIKADDVSIQMLANNLAQKRSAESEARIAKSIDSNGKKLNQIVDAETNLDAKKESNNSKMLENLSLQNQVNFSTLTLQIYEDESIKHEMIVNEKDSNAYRPNIGLQILESIKTGWYILEKILSFIVLLWPFAFIWILFFWGYKKYNKK